MSNKIFFATSNNGKIDFVTEVLEKYGIKVNPVPIDLSEEKAESVKEVARRKVKYAFQEIGKPCIALDSGLFIDSLNGFPGTNVNSTLETIGIEGIITLLEKKEDTRCVIKPCVAYLNENLREPICFVANVYGSLAREPRGVTSEYHWSDLARIFIPSGYDKTEGEMTEQEYKKWRLENDLSVSDFGRYFKERYMSD
jgi:XTP/dITP diphosphohydrolase